MTNTIDPAANLSAIRGKLDAALAEAGRPPGAATVVAVSKRHGEERILPALEAGHRVFGENRVQEAQAKWPQLKARYSDVELHLVGPLQSNKAADAVAIFDAIHSVDRDRIAKALAAEIARQGRAPACLVQVNTGEEPQKSGVAPAQADDFIRRCSEEFGLKVSGVMCLPPVDEPPAPHFALLAKIADRNGLEVVSMGMSADYEDAVRLGATHVRIGTEIFGPRPKD
ncbi:MAG: YggS family pyridoxal phosphate-dependent enzyme [Pseudomonadota bacterium]